MKYEVTYRFRNLCFIPIILLIFNTIYAQTIEQKLNVIQNDGIIGGSLKLAVQVKGTSLTAANTLGSGTIDVRYDNTKLTYSSASGWAFGFADGYQRAATDITTFIRIGITGGGVNQNGDGTPAGFDITSSYVTLVVLNFTITSVTGSVNFDIIGTSNAIGLYENHTNNPFTAVINNQILSAPEVIQNQPLPVELTAFFASSEKNSVFLQWRTATEVNNYGFEIQRCILTKDAKRKWEAVGFVAGHGNSNSPVEYSYTDKSALYGTFIYRLKQIDNDGKYEFSKDIVISVGQRPTRYELRPNYPNPFNPETRIQFTIPKASLVELSVYNIIGAKVAVLENSFLEEGVYQRSFDGSSLPSGIYLYVLQAGDTKLVQKMQLLK